ncbi:uncharacterized protein LOC122368141 [Amphibalanus amphitrite]|uniref:uncharacterized protein LOC122368141 n=1 Tax=Amphibalanus amphitrite TaxID=1232801 RepID=UPI001C91EE30|nr:uncharacterized protein LOC122368141 [Amphibalanus amphitrite]
MTSTVTNKETEMREITSPSDNVTLRVSDAGEGSSRTVRDMDNLPATNAVASRVERSVQSSSGENQTGADITRHFSEKSRSNVTEQTYTAWRYPRLRTTTALYRGAGNSSISDGMGSGIATRRTTTRNLLEKSVTNSSISRNFLHGEFDPGEGSSTSSEGYLTRRASRPVINRRQGAASWNANTVAIRMRRLWSRVSNAMTWLPRMMSRRLHGLRRWMASRRAQWSEGNQVPPDPPRHQRYEQHQGQHQQDYQKEQQREHVRHQHQQKKQKHRAQQQQKQQLLSLPERGPVLDKRLSCACNAPSRRKFRNTNVSSALGQFLSTSFWIPALGLVYLLGLSSGSINNGGSTSGTGAVTVSDTDSVSTTNNDSDTMTNTVTITLTNSPTNTNTATQTSSDTTTTTVTDNSMNTNTGGDNTNTNTNTNNR